MTKAKGFTLVELFVVISILALMAGVITLNSKVGKQTVKNEAEKIATYIHKRMKRSDKTHDSFTIKFRTTDGKDEIWLVWSSKGDTKRKYVDIVPVNPDFNFNYSFGLHITDINYSPKSNTFDFNGHIEIKRVNDENDKYYIIFYNGRIRTSPTKKTIDYS